MEFITCAKGDPVKGSDFKPTTIPPAEAKTDQIYHRSAAKGEPKETDLKALKDSIRSADPNLPKLNLRLIPPSTFHPNTPTTPNTTSDYPDSDEKNSTRSAIDSDDDLADSSNEF
jgi:hypothetical protein